uniref:Uncharacterized protein n=1 Tax=Triticum urartu TaxID=4572 RepID=A0A8R7K0A6_TRIUA
MHSLTAPSSRRTSHLSTLSRCSSTSSTCSDTILTKHPSADDLQKVHDIIHRYISAAN